MTGFAPVNPLSLAKQAHMMAQRATTIIPIGDSITQAGDSLNQLGWAYGGTLPDMAVALSGRFQQIRNAGIGGNTTAQMLARLQTDVIAYAPHACIVFGGTNDYNTSFTNASYPPIMNNIEQMVLQLLAAGILPIIVVPPCKNGYTMARVCRWFYYRLARYYSLPLFDAYLYWVNPAADTWISGYTGDGVHPNTVATAAAAPAFATVLKNLETSPCPPYLGVYSETSGGNPANLLQNGSFTSLTSNVPTGWTGTTTYGAFTSAAAAFPLAGNSVTFSQTSAGNANALVAPTITSGFSVNDTLTFSGNITITGITPATATGFTFGVGMNGANGGARPFNGWQQNGNYTFCYETGVFAGTVNMPVYFNPADNGASYTLSNLTLVDRTVMDAIWRPGLQ